MMISNRQRLGWQAAAMGLAACLAILAATAGRATAGASGAGASSSGAAKAIPSPDAYRHEIDAWRADRESGLRNPEGWLTLVGLFWLQEGDNRFGSDPQSRVVLPAGKAPAFAGTLVLHGGAVTVRAEPGSGVESNGRPVTEMLLAPDAKGKPAVLHLGSLSFFVIKRGDRLGVRVKDSKSPALAAFRGVESFPVDPSWRVVARFEPHATPVSIPITNILGMTENDPSPGVVVFERGGQTYRLDALDNGDGSLELLFKDTTSGRETYGAGRFLDTDAPRDGKVVVDFNKAYNPPCAFTTFATCPLPPRQNHLALAVTAGEKRYGEGHH
jgi:uncharacterized protein (DUF1684 family)